MKFIPLGLIALLLIVILLLYWEGSDQKTRTDIQTQISQEGIYAQLRITPEAGILTGDIIHVSLDVFFDQSQIEVDEDLIAERYIELKENSFVGCEEYNHPELNHEKIEGINHIYLLAEFQCFFTGEQEKTIDFMVQYVTKENSRTSTLQLVKKISFAKISTTDALDFQNYVYEKKNTGLWLIVSGVGLCLVALMLVAHLMFNKYIKPRTMTQPEPDPEDYFSSTIDILRANIEKSDHRDILDKLYHLCRKIIRERGGNEELEMLIEKLSKIYNPQASIEKSTVKRYLDEAKRIAEKGDETKC